MEIGSEGRTESCFLLVRNNLFNKLVEKRMFDSDTDLKQ